MKHQGCFEVPIEKFVMELLDQSNSESDLEEFSLEEVTQADGYNNK